MIFSFEVSKPSTNFKPTSFWNDHMLDVADVVDNSYNSFNWCLYQFKKDDSDW